MSLSIPITPSTEFFSSPYHREILKGTRLLDVGQGGGQVLELQIHRLLGRLGVLDSLDLEGFNSL